MPKPPNVMGFSGSVNGTTKNPGFLDFGFCQCRFLLWVHEIKCDEIASGQFSKITETDCLSGWEFEADKSRYGVYVTRH